ncbi:hypothetical protein MNBD_GAMMA01-321 [hydrothermal vent metagenome]|uniref:Uncharacterized protein n=1 Tax=hydrothermal vent metagenome TaxID=652676 RepID=A0A3B0WB55_9ZZZZ
MKNKVLGFILVLGLLAVYPVWRYYTNAQVFAKAVLDHASALGEWSHQSINSKLDGKIIITNLTFKPENHSQSFEIGSVTITTSPMFILKTSAGDLTYMLPETLSVSVNTASLDNKSNDVLGSLRDKSMWALIAGYAGSFGCSRESYTSFDDKSWKNIIDDEQIYNLDLFYSRQLNGSLDVDLILDAENLFSSIWSSNLKSAYSDTQIDLDELIVEKLYYSYLDNGFNLTRNNACIRNYKSSFAAYRLSSAEHVQRYLRHHFAKELPKVLLNWYQRMLAPEIEYNAIITLNERKYLSDIYRIDQRTLYENSIVEVATTENNYLPVTLSDIDFTSIDTELLKQETIRRQQLEKQDKLVIKKQKADKRKPAIYTTGIKTSRKIAVNRLNTAINKKVRVKTARGRPITGLVKSVTNGLVEIEIIYKTGSAILTISVDKISSAELVK